MEWRGLGTGALAWLAAERGHHVQAHPSMSALCFLKLVQKRNGHVGFSDVVIVPNCLNWLLIHFLHVHDCN